MLGTAGPGNVYSGDRGGRAQSKVGSQVVAAAQARTAARFEVLVAIWRYQFDFGADAVPVTGDSFEVEDDPVVIGGPGRFGKA